MLNFFGKDNSEISQDSGATIRVIGDRASGKTTYMAALARWPNASADSPVQAVTAINDDGKELIELAQNILEQEGLTLLPSTLTGSSDEMKNYSLQITLKNQFSWRNPRITASAQVNLNISCKDYAGEFFADLLQKSGNPQLNDYLGDCAQATGILLIIDGTSYRKDSDYALAVERLMVELDRFGGNETTRIAIGLTKCEQPELWVNRHKPTFLASARFPQLCQKLKSWEEMTNGKVDYFSVSAFGMLGTNYPEPNARLIKRDRGGTNSYIKNPRFWRPFGLVAPIYWLCTGKRHPELDRG
jgi:GTPase SAR1 family protein